MSFVDINNKVLGCYGRCIFLSVEFHHFRCLHISVACRSNSGSIYWDIYNIISFHRRVLCIHLLLFSSPITTTQNLDLIWSRFSMFFTQNRTTGLTQFFFSIKYRSWRVHGLFSVCNKVNSCDLKFSINNHAPTTVLCI